MTSTREIAEGLQEQGVEEEVAYTLTVPVSWGTPLPPPADPPIVKVFSVSSSGTYSDVTSTVMPAGAASVAGQVITLPEMKALTLDVLYRVEVKFETTEGDILEPYAKVQATR